MNNVQPSSQPKIIENLLPATWPDFYMLSEAELIYGWYHSLKTITSKIVLPLEPRFDRRVSKASIYIDVKQKAMKIFL